MANTVLITGANRGVGLALSRHYHQAGWKVIGVCRGDSDELAEVADRVIDGIDVTGEADVARLADELADQSLDLLINNAGMLHDESLGELDFDAIRAQMETNAYAPLRVTEALLPCLGEGAKVANITSRMGSIADNDSGGRYGYRASKAALNAFGKSLAVDLASRGIAVAQLHPGYVQTRMVNFGGLISPEEAAEGIAERIAALTLSTSGGFWHSNGESLPW
ncbi:NAD(P)-dependent dehydrogenase (short-subunit alcohol dehydrogenase family) [Halomonas fontilapidosi]|uniref:NAD(P)-dependent dehydrogenase (Short-subunit alcohol dehydrogenase family) n=1 Tax=Halomonas fontilapidosi TaxID=616675 RepID=A0A7W5GXW6_9GAMM|nr:SDR family oxidoreductase [Halomonas fontilapidosi]MBB3182657.1 NAD(P)-dependent dehydrogenase (short-subunit alcohol dehydrogenase family) [Halomonas fontilapidosi]